MNLPAQILTAIGVAAAAVVADTPAQAGLQPSELTQALTLVERFGVMAVLLVYFVVRDYLRYRADQKEKQTYLEKIEKLQNLILDDHRKSLDEHKDQLNKHKKTHSMLLNALEDFPATSMAAKSLQDTEIIRKG